MNFKYVCSKRSEVHKRQPVFGMNLFYFLKACFLPKSCISYKSVIWNIPDPIPTMSNEPKQKWNLKIKLNIMFGIFSIPFATISQVYLFLISSKKQHIPSPVSYTFCNFLYFILTQMGHFFKTHIMVILHILVLWVETH